MVFFSSLWISYLTCPRYQSILPPGQGLRIGIDPRTISHEKASFISFKFSSLDCKFVFISNNLVDLIWKDKPGKPSGVTYVQNIEYTGEDALSKTYKLRKWMKDQPPAIPSVSKYKIPTPQQMHVGVLVSNLACIGGWSYPHSSTVLCLTRLSGSMDFESPRQRYSIQSLIPCLSLHRSRQSYPFSRFIEGRREYYELLGENWCQTEELHRNLAVFETKRMGWRKGMFSPENLIFSW